MQCHAVPKYVHVSALVRTKTYHIYKAHHKRKPRGEVPILGDIPRNVSNKNYFDCLALVASVSASFQAFTKTAIVPQGCKRAFAKQCICLDTFRKLQESVCNMYMLSDMYACTSSDKNKRESARANERKREGESVIVVYIFLLNLTGTEALTPLLSAHNLLHNGIA